MTSKFREILVVKLYVGCSSVRTKDTSFSTVNDSVSGPAHERHLQNTTPAHALGVALFISFIPYNVFARCITILAALSVYIKFVFLQVVNC